MRYHLNSTYAYVPTGQHSCCAHLSELLGGEGDEELDWPIMKFFDVTLPNNTTAYHSNSALLNSK